MTREENFKAEILKACEAAHAKGIKIGPEFFGVCVGMSGTFELMKLATYDTDTDTNTYTDAHSSVCAIGAYLLDKPCINDRSMLESAGYSLDVSKDNLWDFVFGFDGNELMQNSEPVFYKIGRELRNELKEKGIM